MSYSASYEWELQQELRRQEYLSRITATTRGFLERYQIILHDLETQGLTRYVPKEYERARDAVEEIAANLNSDPEYARQMSQDASAAIHALPHLARAARERIREDEAAAKKELDIFLDSILGEIADPIERDFARRGTAELRKNYSHISTSTAGLVEIKDRIRPQIASIRTRAAEEAKSWKDNFNREHQAEIRSDMVQAAKGVTLDNGIKEPEALKHLETLWQSLERDTRSSGEAFSTQLTEAVDQTDIAAVDESCRRATIRAIFDSLKQAGFSVEQPRLVRGEREEVIVVARKPSGAQAEFRVSVDGGMIYRFDQYEGQACRKDIEQVLPVLQDIYGINLSQERILWVNPDRLSRDAKPINNSEVHRG